MIDNQLGRRNLPNYPCVILNQKKESILRPIAKANLKTAKKGVFGGAPLSKTTKAVNVREVIAKVSKVSENTVHKVKFIKDKIDQKTKDKLNKGEETIN